MPVIRCKEFKVPCRPAKESCEVCVLRLRAVAREAERARRRVLLGKADGTDGRLGEDLLPAE